MTENTVSESGNKDKNPCEAADCRPLEVNIRHARVLRSALDYWHETGLLSDEQLKTLDASIRVGINWRRIIFHFTWIAVCCMIIAVGSLLCSDLIVRLMNNTPAAVKTVGAFAMAAGFICSGLVQKEKSPEYVKTYSLLLVLGCLCIASGLFCFGMALNLPEAGMVWMMMVGCFVYGAVAWFGKSGLVWLFALISFCNWLGCSSGYSFGAYWLAIKEPYRFLIFGGLLTLLSCWPVSAGILQSRDLLGMSRAYGILVSFTALWFLSIFGDSNPELFFWALVLGAVALYAIWLGVKTESRMLLGFGCAFMGIDLYTKYFEYFWDRLHVSIFFFLSGAGLLIGIKCIRKFIIDREKGRVVSDD